jgi:hypothetical protein
MNSRSFLLGLSLLLLMAVWFVAPPTIVRGQNGNGPLIWVDFQVLNRTGTMRLQGLNPILLTEVLTLSIAANVKHHGVPWATLTVSGGGTFHIGQPAQTQAALWTGLDNRTSNSVDYTLLALSPEGSTTTQTIHVFNVPGNTTFWLGDAYNFSSKGNYAVLVRLNLVDAYVENSTNIKVMYP